MAIVGVFIREPLTIWIRSVLIRVAYDTVMLVLLLRLLVLHGISISRLVLVVSVSAIFHSGSLCSVAGAVVPLWVGVFGESVGVVMGTSRGLFAAKETAEEAAAAG